MVRKKYECPLCNMSFATENYRDIHVSRHTRQLNNEFSNKLVCSECGRRFLRKDYLIAHMRRHRKEMFKCKYCEKGKEKQWIYNLSLVLLDLGHGNKKETNSTCWSFVVFITSSFSYDCFSSPEDGVITLISSLYPDPAKRHWKYIGSQRTFTLELFFHYVAVFI